MLRYVPLAELERIRALEAEPTERAAAFADACRLNTLYMIARAGSGHLGTSFSCMDVLSWLHLEEMEEGDRYFSSKGHDAPALYSVMIALGRLDFDLIHRLRRLGGLPGHPDVLSTPGVITNTGSLGMGISKARGFVLADRLAGRPPSSVYVLTGDGELQEGQFWESLQPTANRGIGEITVIVDSNKLQSDTWVSEVSDLGDLEARVSACGWVVARTDGNDLPAVAVALARLRDAAEGRPKLLIADTVKGAGASVMEPHDLLKSPTSLYDFHSGAPSAEHLEAAVSEISERLSRRLEGLGEQAPRFEQAERGAAPATPREVSVQRLIPAYGEALARLGEEHEQLVALDADLVLDTGLIPFRDRFPERFFECGIAEQDMVSQAGAMALSGLLPAVHSFACFLSTRPNEQIYNNATEGTKVIYVGSLAGIIPGGPGHSHQSVRDISALGAMPGMALIEPFCETEVGAAMRWAVHEAAGPVYLRLVTPPWELGFDPPSVAELVPGRGTHLCEGADALLVCTGPVLVSQAWAAAELLKREGVRAGLVALPWLRDVDGAWLAGIAGQAPVFCLDNHYREAGQGDAVLAALSAAGHAAPVHKLGVEEVPACGANDEVLVVHGLDAESVAQRVRALMPVRS
jgi:transketolase